jgi:hypothetical protein
MNDSAHEALFRDSWAVRLSSDYIGHSVLSPSVNIVVGVNDSQDVDFFPTPYTFS